ncbi:hypothetical protein HOLleu_26713 [Holothuria leucospilota]|uniref:Uncharacterized protein n=1 Tax=Holothuria leucospilota TaxID=206669 RepID=A0A9Q1BP17_HOLLE|nr:hypothetical protein HOLleu_26713 [Holothuria leucospilota]
MERSKRKSYQSCSKWFTSPCSPCETKYKHRRRNTVRLRSEGCIMEMQGIQNDIVHNCGSHFYRTIVKYKQ